MAFFDCQSGGTNNTITVTYKDDSSVYTWGNSHGIQFYHRITPFSIDTSSNIKSFTIDSIISLQLNWTLTVGGVSTSIVTGQEYEFSTSASLYGTQAASNPYNQTETNTYTIVVTYKLK